MKQVVIENPIINSPFAEPNRHFRFTDDGITDEIVESRRISSYFIPVARPKKKGKQLQFDTEWTQDRVEENKFINRVRAKVSQWRSGGYTSVTKTTRALLEYWNNPARDKKLFFCQIEALETAIYITEVAGKYDPWIENDLRRENEAANPLLFRMALKMATGSGKTVVMAMLIAWHALNKLANPQDARFSDSFLIVTPGITIRDRLRVLLPNDPENYYRQRDVLSSDLMMELGKAKILITNFHAFKLKERVSAGKLTKSILAREGNSPFTETPDQMVHRVCREFGNKKNIMVINDEAHHCYRRKPDGEGEQLKGDEKKEAEKRDEEARIWISGLEAIKSKIGAKVVYDLSATPFFLKGSGYPEGTLFPWVVSDFSLIDAIESGIVKVPRVPVADDSMTGEQPTYRDLWLRIREHLPKKGRRTDEILGDPKLPVELEGALQSLYGNYEKNYRRWAENEEARLLKGLTPPVFIVVCNNTNVSKLVFDYVAGWEKPMPDGSSVVVPGKLPIFSNEEHHKWALHPNTVLIDSEQLESGEAMSDEFKLMAKKEIDEFKEEYRVRFPGRDAEELTDEDLLREVMNTVGKPGKLGEHVKCVVSVSMLTEGWDANTVTHILGVRAFGTQLLCEQVVGRGLRRMSYAADERSFFTPEYAEVYGVPFSFIPCSGSNSNPKPGPTPTRVRALEDRIDCEITFPRLLGYRFEMPEERFEVRFTDDSKLALTTADVPTKTENAPIVGESSIHTLDDLKRRRPQEVAFLLAKLTLEKYFRADGEISSDKPKEHRFDSEVKSWLFPQLLSVAKRWLSECVICKDNTFPQMLLLIGLAHDASDRIYKAIVRSYQGEKILKPILRPYDTVGSTRYVDFDTTRPVYVTNPSKCHISHVVADTESWEQKMAQVLEDELDDVVCYVKNFNLGFMIPYTINGEERNYIPDFVVCLHNGRGDPLNLIIEVTGEKKKDKAAKVGTARDLWVPAVNNHGGFGRWAFLEIADPWDAKNTISGELKKIKLET
ncbi:MAG: DEAD/DEAH box helicase family protein [Deltaproteobacteria bacterium]|nr:DEAD/DEAH box helicase family protein [Deltaproteobacteria bacterium]